MNIKHLKNAKTSKRKSECLTKLTIVKNVNSFTVFAVTGSGGFIPLRVGSLQEVISEAEHCSAYLGLPVAHELNPPVRLNLNRYRKIGTQWLWVGQKALSYPDANEAYLSLRGLNAEIDGSCLVVEAGSVKVYYTCSHDCSSQWITILHRLQFDGQLPPGKTKGTCNCCFSLFVNSSEGGDVCLNCGHEQTRD